MSRLRRVQSAEHVVLGRAVRELRARRALSQERLGSEGGLHRNYVGAIERGEINPTFAVLDATEDHVLSRADAMRHGFAPRAAPVYRRR